MRSRHNLFALVIAVTLGVMIAPALRAADRMALVIGMGDYSRGGFPSLKNAVPDANAIAAALEGVGFEVTRVIDSPQAALEDTLKAFSVEAEVADLALVYFAGHGVQFDGENYLLPIDVEAATNAEVARQSFSLQRFLAAVDGARQMRVVILDSCRDNPLAGVGQVEDRAAAVAPAAVETTGLAPPAPDRGTLVAFSAKEGRTALDGDGAHSPYATALMEALATPGLEISLMFRRVRDAVLQATANVQEPHTYGSLSSEPFYLAGPGPGGAALPRDDKVSAWSALRPEDEPMLLALAEAGDTRSLVGLAYRRLNEAGTYDPVAAAALLQRAADAGSPVAQFELAKLYERGQGVARDPDRALALFQAAADQGLADALNDVGIFHHNGLFGLTPDFETAVSYFKRAADLRHAVAQFNYAAMIDDGRIPGMGPQAAAGYLYSALRSGNARVLNVLLNDPTQFKLETRQALQGLLKDRDFYDGALDGSFGPGTNRGLRQAFGDEVDG